MERQVANATVLLFCSVAAKVRGGAWVDGAPTHIFAELLTELENAGWKITPPPTGKAARRAARRAEMPEPDPLLIAKAFHDAYEHLAPEHGYETRRASAKPWEEVPENNRNLMVATVQDLIDAGHIL